MCCYLFRVLLISTCQLLKFYVNLLRRISGFQCSVLTKCSSNACCIHANNRAVTIARLRCRRYFTPEFLVPSPRGIALFCSWGLQAVVICGQFCACCNYSRQHLCCHTCWQQHFRHACLYLCCTGCIYAIYYLGSRKVRHPGQVYAASTDHLCTLSSTLAFSSTPNVSSHCKPVNPCIFLPSYPKKAFFKMTGLVLVSESVHTHVWEKIDNWLSRARNLPLLTENFSVSTSAFPSICSTDTLSCLNWTN